jgi:hypothetical protein
MSYRTLNINSAAVLAVAAFGAATAVRMRETEDGLQVRPTDRTNLTNLPKGEILRPVSAKANARVVGLPTETLPNLAADTVMAFEPGKYGWFTLRQVAELPKGTAGATVRAK